MERNTLPTILFPRGGRLNDMSAAKDLVGGGSAGTSKAGMLSASSNSSSALLRTPPKPSLTPSRRPFNNDNDHGDDDGTSSKGTPTPRRQHKRLRTARDYMARRRVPSKLAFPPNLDESINAAFAEEQYDAAFETIDHVRANGIVTAEHHLRILYAFALRPTPDSTSYRQTAAALAGSVSAPPSLPLIKRSRVLLLELAELHGAARILRALSPAKVSHSGGIDALSKSSLGASVRGKDHARPHQIQGRSGNSPNSNSDSEGDNDATFFDDETPVAQLQKNAFLRPMPLVKKGGSSSRHAHMAPAVADSWELLRTPPPGALFEGDLLRRAAAAHVEGDDGNEESLSLAAAHIRNVAMRHPHRRRGRGRGRSSSVAAASASSSRVASSSSSLTEEDLMRHAPATMDKYHETIYGADGARDALRKRAVNGEALTFLAPLWQAERRSVMYKSQKGKEAAHRSPLDSEFDVFDSDAIKSFYGLSLAWEFAIDRTKAQQISDAARKALQKKVTPVVSTGGKTNASVPTTGTASAPALPPAPATGPPLPPALAPIAAPAPAPPPTMATTSKSSALPSASQPTAKMHPFFSQSKGSTKDSVHPFFSQHFATSAAPVEFRRSSSVSRSSPAPHPSQGSSQASGRSGHGGGGAANPPSSPLSSLTSISALSSSPGGPPTTSSSMSLSAASSHRTAMSSGPQGCLEVGKALDALFEVLAGNVLLCDRDGMFRSALAMLPAGAATGEHGGGSGEGAGTANVSAVADLGQGSPALRMRWREMVGAAGKALFEILQLTRRADGKTAPVLDFDAVERGITLRLAWSDVGADAIMLADQAIHTSLAEERLFATRTSGRRGNVESALDWDTEPSLGWMRALVDHMKGVGSVLRQAPPNPPIRIPSSQRSSTADHAPSARARSNRSGSTPAASSAWESKLGALLRFLPASFAWMEINRMRLMDKHQDLADEGVERFADIDAKREKRVWADLEDLMAEQNVLGDAGGVDDLDKEISEVLVVRGRQPASTSRAPARTRRERSPSVLFMFESRSSVPESDRRCKTHGRDDSPGFEIVQVTPTKRQKSVAKEEFGLPPPSKAKRARPGMQDVKMEEARSTRSQTPTTALPSAPTSAKAPPTAKPAAPKLSGSEAIQAQTQEWVLDWGLDAHRSLNSPRLVAQVIETKAPADATLEEHKTRLHALLRVAEVVLGEVRRRRKAAAIKYAVLMWARRCAVVPSSSSPPARTSTATKRPPWLSKDEEDDMDWSAAPSSTHPSSSAGASAALGTLTLGSDAGPTPSSGTSTTLSSTARQLVDKLDKLCQDAATSSDYSLGHAERWIQALRGVWEEALSLGLVPLSHTSTTSSSSASSSHLGASSASGKQVKSELGEAVNWAFTLEMERVLGAVAAEVQGLAGISFGWTMLGL